MTTSNSNNGTSLHQGRSNGAHDHGANIAGLVLEGVRRAREKLIDLSMRNTMLNFRHSETSARHVRIVDEDLKSMAAGHTDAIDPKRSFGDFAW